MDSDDRSRRRRRRRCSESDSSSEDRGRHSKRRKDVKRRQDSDSDSGSRYRSRRSERARDSRRRRHSDSEGGSRDRSGRSARTRDTKRRRQSDSDNGSRDRSRLLERTGDDKTEKPEKSGKADLLTTRTGGAYIPPAKLKMLQEQITDKSSEAYQRLTWEALKKSLNGLINKVNVSNISFIVREVFRENLVRGRGLFARSLMKAQASSPSFTHVYAALVAIINTKLPQIGEFVVRRLVLQFRRSYRRNNKALCTSTGRFLAHLVNQAVVHEIVALQILTLLLEHPTNDSLEIAIAFMKESGAKLTDVCPRGVHGLFERLRSILHDGQVDKRVQYMIEVMFAIRKDKFKDHPAVIEELDLVEEEDQVTHLIDLEDVGDPESILDVFRADPDYLENEEKYKELREEIVGGSDDEESESGEEESDDDEEAAAGKMDIHDMTDTNVVGFRRVIYLTIMSSLTFEECAHKFLKMEIKPGMERPLCEMVLECCSVERSYLKFYGQLAERLCQINKVFQECYCELFREQYETIHRLETNKLRNVAKIYSWLLYKDAVPWTILQCIQLSEEETTSSSRIFVKVLFQELSEFMGLPKFNTRLKDQFLSPYFEGILPRDNPKNTRFAINFFTMIGLGGLTDDLREHLKQTTKRLRAAPAIAARPASSDSSGDDSDSETDSSDSDSDSDSETSSSDSD